MGVPKVEQVLPSSQDEQCFLPCKKLKTSNCSMAPDSQFIKVCHSKSDTKQYLMHRPTGHSILIVPKRFLTGLHYIMTDCSMMTEPVDSPYHKFFQQGRKRVEPVVQLKVPGDVRPQAKCTAVDSQAIDKHLMFNATVQGKRVRIWLDT